jgi:hypothetical protein
MLRTYEASDNFLKVSISCRRVPTCGHYNYQLGKIRHVLPWTDLQPGAPGGVPASEPMATARWITRENANHQFNITSDLLLGENKEH